ncbi:hypothetical protein BJX68DRAFT_76862 [Aspergillus pseudodeflectus]|uniref:Uncharacterized protein n=1 Tax=Aspergillus pseudodeflectus TaxID=176178 RepID=A0ABR4KFD4_9EURO
MIGPANCGTRDEILPELHIPGSGSVWNPVVKVVIIIKYGGQVRIFLANPDTIKRSNSAFISCTSLDGPRVLSQ